MTDTLTRADLLTLTTNLDQARNMFGPLSPEIRARIFAAVDTPSRETWVAARSAMVTPSMTLWQAVAAWTGDTDETVTPTTREIIDGLAEAQRVAWNKCDDCCPVPTCDECGPCDEHDSTDPWD